MDVLAEGYVPARKLIRWTVARTVDDPRLRHQVEEGVFDAVVEACLHRDDFDRVTTKWIRTTARRVTFGRKRRDRCMLALDPEHPAPDPPATDTACDPMHCAALERPFAKLGKRARSACLVVRSTGNVALAAEATGMSPQNVHRALRRLGDLAREFLQRMTLPGH
ncbi:MAG: hypothetical protein HZB39_20420 [Planctomycetes bacterium]|nr:hypothetical protein [Planctomycetota bacterium]